MRVLVFGDSITQGYWAVEHGWVDRIRKYFDEQQFQDLQNRDEPTIFNLGISADTSRDVLSRIDSEVKARTRSHHAKKPIVLLQIGTNDSCREPEQNKVAVEEYRKNLAEITEKVKALGSSIIFVGSSACDDSRTNPVSWGEYYYRNEDIKRYEENMAETAETLGVAFIPVFSQFKAKLEMGEDLLPDGLHPNDAGHELIYHIVKPKLKELLR